MYIVGINLMLTTSLLIFFVGLSGLTVTRKNILVTLMAANLNFVTFFQSSLSTFFDSINLEKLSLVPEFFFLAFTSVIIINHCSLIAYNKRYNSVLIQFSITSLCTLILFLTFILYFHVSSHTVKHLSFEFSFLSDSLGFLSKIITIISSLICMYLLQDYRITRATREYNLLMLYAILGLTMLITANDFGTIFLSISIQSLSLYILSISKKNSVYSFESELKYFILGALPAACFLLGGTLFIKITFFVSVLLLMLLFLLLAFCLFRAAFAVKISMELFRSYEKEEFQEIFFSDLETINVLEQLCQLFCFDDSETSKDILNWPVLDVFGGQFDVKNAQCSVTKEKAGRILRASLNVLENLGLMTGHIEKIGHAKAALKRGFLILGFVPTENDPDLRLTDEELAFPIDNQELLSVAILLHKASMDETLVPNSEWRLFFKDVMFILLELMPTIVEGPDPLVYEFCKTMLTTEFLNEQRRLTQWRLYRLEAARGADPIRDQAEVFNALGIVCCGALIPICLSAVLYILIIINR